MVPNALVVTARVERLCIAGELDVLALRRADSYRAFAMLADVCPLRLRQRVVLRGRILGCHRSLLSTSKYWVLRFLLGVLASFEQV